MATNPNTLPENSGRITAPDADYPYGSAKDDSTGTTGDGTPIKKALMNDTYGFYQKLMVEAGVVPSGNAETVNDSDLFDSLRALFGSGSVKITAITSSDPAWTPTAGVKSIEFLYVGGGGGGGNGQFALSCPTSGAGGGWGIVSPSVVDATYNIVIGFSGAGANAGTGANGAQGGTTSITSANVNATASGGLGGVGSVLNGGSGKNGGVLGGVPTGADYGATGSSSGTAATITGQFGPTSMSGSSFFGGSLDGDTGSSPSAPGAGGSSKTVTKAGNGATGIVIVKEYF